MFNMKSINGQDSKQSSFLLNSHAHNCIPYDDRVLQKDYGRQGDLDGQLGNIDHSRPLVNYLFYSEDTSKVQETSTFPLNASKQGSFGMTGKQVGKNYFACEEGKSYKRDELMNKIRVNKKMKNQDRIKTDFGDGEDNLSEEVAHLKRENQILKQQLMKYEKNMITVQSVQSEVQYLKKLSFLQQSQIQKLRVIVKQAQGEKVERFYNEITNQNQTFRLLLSDLSVNKQQGDLNIKKINKGLRNMEIQRKKSTKKSGSVKMEKQNFQGYRTYSQLTEGQDSKGFEPKTKSTRKNSMPQKKNSIKLPFKKTYF